MRGLYLPAWQSEHSVAALCENSPSLQNLHVSLLVAADTLEYVPPSHDAHGPVAPGRVEYFPASHTMQVKLEFAATVVEIVPFGQRRQVDSELAWLALEYIPAAHELQ